MASRRRKLDSASLIAQDKLEAERLKREGGEVRSLGRAGMSASMSFRDARFSDPGGASPGNSIKCPDIYEALKRKGMSKSQAAAISNAQCNK